MEISLNIEIKDSKRFIAPGLLFFFLYLTTFTALPFSVETSLLMDLALSPFIIFFSGITIDTIATRTSGPVVNTLHCTRAYMKHVCRLLLRRDSRNTGEPSKFETMAKATTEEKEELRTHELHARMLGGFALVLLFYLLTPAIINPILLALQLAPLTPLVQLPYVAHTVIVSLLISIMVLGGLVSYSNFCRLRESIKNRPVRTQPRQRRQEIDSDTIGIAGMQGSTKT